MKKLQGFRKIVLASTLPLLSLTTMSQAVELKVKVENLTPIGGVFFTPLWVGFHDGSFDTYNLGETASDAIERIAEDGDASVLVSTFQSAMSNGQTAVITNPEGFAGAPVFEPGSVSTMVFDVDSSMQKYFSYANMIIPSNDAFIANDNPKAYQLFDANGNFTGPISFVVYGNQVLDAGTEENTETDAAFLNQSAGNTGTTSSDMIALHSGYNGSVGNPNGTPVNILGGTVASGDMIDPIIGDFSRNNYPIIRITIAKSTIPIRLTIKNTAGENGTFLTPFWVGFHDGSFDLYDTGMPASASLERLAEDGDSTFISANFTAAAAGMDSVITNPEGFAGAPLFDPGLSTQTIVELDPQSHRYFSYAAMLLPSNDAFIANDDAVRYQLFDENGVFMAQSFKIYGSDVKDAGTEENTESDAAFFNQSEANTGVTTAHNIHAHAGFNGSVGNPNGSPQVFLGGTNPAGFSFDSNADFTRGGAQVAEIAISRMVDGSFSGTWYDPNRNGEGFVIDISENAASHESNAVVSWYTYNADNSGSQAWLIGSGAVIADTVFADVQITQGTSFGDNFIATDVVKNMWGQVKIKFTDCTHAIVSYTSLDSNYGSGSYDLVRSTQGPVDFKGACQL